MWVPPPGIYGALLRKGTSIKNSSYHSFHLNDVLIMQNAFAFVCRSPHGGVWKSKKFGIRNPSCLEWFSSIKSRKNIPSPMLLYLWQMLSSMNHENVNYFSSVRLKYAKLRNSTQDALWRDCESWQRKQLISESSARLRCLLEICAALSAFHPRGRGTHIWNRRGCSSSRLGV